jgi:MoxR-like ATPase
MFLMSSEASDRNDREVRALTAFLDPVRAELHRVLIGQDRLVDALLCGLLTGGHVLIEGVPGLAKTLAVRALAATVGGAFSRIQFTPDLLPADLLGTLMYNPEARSFSVRQGPIFANLLLADEINRAPAKVQSALLEAMQERQVTLGGETRPLPQPFLVLATQNPIEHAGTYPLPEAQLDRFLLRAVVSYPGRDDEREIIARMATPAPDLAVRQITDLATVLQARRAVDLVYVDRRITEYILDVVIATRPGHTHELADGQDREAVGAVSALVEYGVSPRAALALTLATRCQAILSGRSHAIPQDVKEVAVAVLAHRLVPAFEADARGLSATDLVGEILRVLRTP